MSVIPVTWRSGDQNRPFRPDRIIIATTDQIFTVRWQFEEIEEPRTGRWKRQEEDEKKSSEITGHRIVSDKWRSETGSRYDEREGEEGISAL